MSIVDRLPNGFLAGGLNAGIKNSKRDLGVIVCEAPAAMAACVTTNKTRAHCVDRIERLLAAGQAVRAIVACSGNANALTGPAGAEDDEAIARAVADAIGVSPDEIVTASTGVIGARLPLGKIRRKIPDLVADLGNEPQRFAESILTTDRVTKLAAKEIFVSGRRVQLHGVAKGAGMIAPTMATMLCFVTTDAVVPPAVLQSALTKAVKGSFNQITIDSDMSTNDAVVALASATAGNEPLEPGTPETEAFETALAEMLVELAQAIARDGEGATRMLEVEVFGAASQEHARQMAVGVAGSMLVKAAIFGADPYAWGRVTSAIGAKAAAIGADLDVDKLTVWMQGVKLFAAGAPVEQPDDGHGLKHRMTEPVIRLEADLGLGKERGVAWGCDLTYDYVKINADYASLTKTAPDGSVSVDERLEEFGPTIKKKLLIEALRYIERFHGLRAVIKLGGAAMVDPQLEAEFAEDVVLLESVGLRPIVVHGGGPEISRTLDRLGIGTEFVDGLRVTNDASMSVVEMVLTGRVNQGIVAAINKTGAKGVGVSGKDGGLIRARKLEGPRDLGRVGEVTNVDTTLLDMLLNDRRIPVVSPVGLADDGGAYNINADVAAAALASALGAHKLVFLSDVPGLLDGEAVVSQLNGDQLKGRIERGEVTGGMLPKLQSSLQALRGGVECVHLVDGRVPHNLIAELFTDSGVGTLIRRA